MRTGGSSATTLESISKAKARLTQFLKTIDTVPAKILSQESSAIRKEAKQMTPYKTGKLEKSVYVRVSKDSRRPGIVIGASAKHKGYNYAGIQHENTRFRHPIKGRAKYLLIPYDKGVRRIKRLLKEKVRVK